MNRFLGAFRNTLESLSYIAVILAVPLFFLQQMQLQHDGRVENAMEFIRMANSEDYATVRATLSAPWKIFNVKSFLATKPSPEAISQARLAATSEIQDEDIEKLVDFYTLVILCRDENICDQEITDKFFSPDINGFYCSYKERLDSIKDRLNREEYAEKLQRYSKNCS